MGPGPRTRCGRFANFPAPIVKAARSWVGAAENGANRGHLLSSMAHASDVLKPLAQPWNICKWGVQGVQIRRALHGFALIPLHGELHTDALKQGVAKFRNPRAQDRPLRISGRLLQDSGGGI